MAFGERFIAQNDQRCMNLFCVDMGMVVSVFSGKWEGHDMHVDQELKAFLKDID